MTEYCSVPINNSGSSLCLSDRTLTNDKKYVIELGCFPTYSPTWIELSKTYDLGETTCVETDTLSQVDDSLKSAVTLEYGEAHLDGWLHVGINVTNSFSREGRFQVPSLYLYPYGCLIVAINEFTHNKDGVSMYKNVVLHMFDLGLGTHLKDDSPIFAEPKCDVERALILTCLEFPTKYEDFVYQDEHIFYTGDPSQAILLRLSVKEAVNPNTMEPLKRNKGLKWCIRKIMLFVPENALKKTST